MKSSIKNLSKAALLICGAWLFLITTTSGMHAQGSGVKPIRLVSGDIIPDIVTPAEAKVAAGASFDGKTFKLIQFKQIPGDREQQQWAAAGLRLVDYLPDDTYFAVIEQGFDLDRLTDQAVTIIEVADIFRFEPSLAGLIAQGGAADRLVISYYTDLDAATVMAALQARGVAIQAHRDYSRQLDITLDPARLREVLALPFIQFAGLPPETPTLEPYDHRNATGRANYVNTGYNSLNYNGAGVVVGIGESGTVDSLVDVKGRLTEMESGASSSHKIGVMQNAGGAGNLDPSNRNNAWGATFLSVVGSPDYAALYSSHNLRYTNHSYGVAISGGYDQSARDHDLRIATYPNHLVIYSSGNSGDEQGYAPYNFAGCPGAPSDCWANITGQMKQNKDMFAIGALELDDDLTSFSSRGPMYDGRIIPQLVIEGIEGTSDAAPKVTGEVAMLAQVYKAKNSGSEPTSSLLRAIMMNTADDLGNAGPDFKHGYGRPNLRRAYNVIDNAQFLTGSVSHGGTNSHTITVPANTKQVRVMIVWPDVAAAVSANPAIVNNLDLVAKDPSNVSYNPWVLDHSASVAASISRRTRSVDSRNTIEQVTLDDPASGNWTMEVSGTSVPTGPQTYYLTYEFLTDELTMMFPLKDHRFVSGTAYHLKWDSYGASGTFSLDYRLDGGSWTSITSGYSATSRTYSWAAPSVTGIHTIEFRVQRSALTATSDVNTIGSVPQNLALSWACSDAVKLTWNAVSGATGYKVYRLGTQVMEEVSSGIAFDGASALLTGQSTTATEYYAVSAVTGSYEGLRTAALTKSVGDYLCVYVQTRVSRSVDETDVTLHGQVNPHNTALTNVHFEYGATTSYGSSSASISISASGHTDEAVNATVSSILADRANVLHYRLVATKDGSTTVYGDDQEIRLTPGYAMSFDGTDDYLNLSSHASLPVYRNGAGTAYSISFWIKAAAAASSGKVIYSEGSSTSGNPRLVFQTSGSYPSGTWILLYNDSGTNLVNSSRNMQLLDNTWHHFTWVDSNGTAKVYLDGNQSGSDITYTPSTLTLNTASVGARLTSSASNFFPGTFDEITFWDKALSATEIRNLMHQPLQGDEANLVAYYRLDDGPADHVYDAVSLTEATIVGGATKTSSTAPLGTVGAAVYTNSQTTIGDAGKQLKVTITSPSQPSTSSYLGIYRVGAGATNVTAETFPSGVTQRASIFWGIKEFGSVTADLVIDYSSVPGISNPAVIKLLKRSDAASAWTDVTADYTHDTGNRTFTGTGVTDFSEFAVGDDGSNPLSAALADFSAVQSGEAMRVSWETVSEVGNVGFNLWRGTSPAAPDVQLNSSLIPSQAPGSSQGFSYEWLDAANLVNNTTYYYWLEDVDIAGVAPPGPPPGPLPRPPPPPPPARAGPRGPASTA
ncbi:MAG: S8 family serine peptidase [Anaerolineae bacterium]|uniref:LamG-like jellyroll fold domain-containing protein n=1 Tax=Candidatus Amarolinea dominans TaxID=3140696 RepID=UPI003135634C|nr:S8 family serine peptidase [Anaerolineae bacterium]